MRYPATLTIPISLSRDAPRPLHEQVVAQVRTAIHDGLLAAGCQLPSSRTLAHLLGVSRGVVTVAYDELFTAGYLDSRAGSGTYVAARPRRDPEVTLAARPASGPAEMIDLSPGQPNLEVFPLSAWRAAWRQASFRHPPAAGLPPLGLPELRHAIATHLQRTWALALPNSVVVVTTGRWDGLRVLLGTLGVTAAQVAVEEPSSPSLRHLVGDGEVPGAAIPAGATGALPDPLPAACRAVVVSPDAPPSGEAMSAQRRQDLARWAARTGGRIVELARDAAPSPGMGRLPRLINLTRGRSILVGGFCELLTPSLKLGYVVVPGDLAGPVRARILSQANQPSYTTQRAVAQLLGDGTVARLMRRLDAAAARKRRMVTSALAPVAGIRLDAPETLDMATVHLLDGAPADRVADLLLARGVRVTTLAPYHFSGLPVRSALVIGYGHQPDRTLGRALSTLVAVLTGPAMGCLRRG
ncbi:MAG TPA: PLP-dependent aminotransferase family protein [Pilimelia sp.]|nr:PLP-dependent aminotransferase family protein [Pilimelia sp.]